MKFGDFTTLAKEYALWRPGYSTFVLDTFVKLLDKNDATVADIGAGTGIWSRALESKGIHVISVEPNDAMRGEGQKQCNGMAIQWHKGDAEETGLSDHSVDAVCMASAFHWANFDKAIPEFFRIVKPGGLAMVLWNPRYIQSNPLLVEIEGYLKTLMPEMKRVSSGNSDFCNSLFERLSGRTEIDGVLYLESRHIERQTKERYIGLWNSVNDIKVQLGEARFTQFIDYIKNRIKDVQYIDAEYKTRAWISRFRK